MITEFSKFLNYTVHKLLVCYFQFENVQIENNVQINVSRCSAISVKLSMNKISILENLIRQKNLNKLKSNFFVFRAPTHF